MYIISGFHNRTYIISCHTYVLAKNSWPFAADSVLGQVLCWTSYELSSNLCLLEWFWLCHCHYFNYEINPDHLTNKILQNSTKTLIDLFLCEWIYKTERLCWKYQQRNIFRLTIIDPKHVTSTAGTSNLSKLSAGTYLITLTIFQPFFFINKAHIYFWELEKCEAFVYILNY